jgi:hypothetical protein
MMSQLARLFGMALCAVCSNTGSAMAERESGDLGIGIVYETSDLTHADVCPDWQAALCNADQMRWGLCERGVGEKPFPDPDVQQCFLRSN